MQIEKRGKGIPFVRISETSFQAAESLRSDLGRLEGLVLAYIGESLNLRG